MFGSTHPGEFDRARIAITGAAGGIGLALADRFLAEGARVVGLDLDAERLAEIERERDGFTSRQLDVTSWPAVREAFDEIGPQDVVVLGAGLTALGALDQTPPDAIDRVLDVNLRGAIYCAKAALPGLIERRGRIAVLSSVAGIAPLVHRTTYAASKHGLHGFFDSLRPELADQGVSITMVCPAFVATGIEDRAAFRAAGGGGAWSTTGRVLTADEVAVAIRDGLAQRKRLVLPSATARLAYVVSRLAPAQYEAMMRRRISG